MKALSTLAIISQNRQCRSRILIPLALTTWKRPNVRHQTRREAAAQRGLPAVACIPSLRLSKNPEIEKSNVHNSFFFKRHFSVKTPKLDFFDHLVRRLAPERHRKPCRSSATPGC